MSSASIDRYELTLPLVPTLNRLVRMHWSARRKLQRELDWMAVAQRNAGPRVGLPIQGGRIQVLRVAMGKEPDPDNLAGGMKLVLDALQHANIIVEDSPDRFTIAPFWARADCRDEQRTIVTIDPSA